MRNSSEPFRVGWTNVYHEGDEVHYGEYWHSREQAINSRSDNWGKLVYRIKTTMKREQQ